MAFNARAKVLDADDVARMVKRISHEILERNKGSTDLVLVGVRTRGVFLARRLARTIEEIEGGRVQAGELDVAFYRDDIATRPSSSPRRTRSTSRRPTRSSRASTSTAPS